MSTLGSATLTEAIPAQRAVAAVVSRDEITAALGDGEREVELSLQIAHADEGGIEERSTVSMTWSRDELERLLQAATSDRVVLTFDRDELAAALVDVAAHGLRERALVFAVAAAGAIGSSATIANAMPAPDEGFSASQSTATTLVTDASSGAGYAAPAAASEGAAMVTDASSGAGYTAPAAVSDGGALVTDAASGAGYAGPAAASDSSGLVTDASSAAGYGPGTASDGTGSPGATAGIHVPGTEDALLGAGLALAVVGATFVARRSSTPRPA
jgi:hypothetical protein